MTASVTELLTRHAKSYNADRHDGRYAVCRCGRQMRLDGSSTADDARTFAEHQAEELAK